MINPIPESPRKLMDRVDRIKRRVKQLEKFNQQSARTGEISALKWAIPILEQHIIDLHGELPTSRYPMYKHEREAMVMRLLHRDGNVCYLCDEPMIRADMTIDHKIPLSKGGIDGYTNMKLTHLGCNLLKDNLTFEEYVKQYKSDTLKNNAG